MTKHNTLLTLLLFISFCGTWVVAQPRSFRPKNGFIPDEITAIRVAEAILSAIYGEEQIMSQRPFSAKLKAGIWIVTGNLPEGRLGGVAEIKISKKTGEVIAVTHGK